MPALLLLGSIGSYYLVGKTLTWQLEVRVAVRSLNNAHYSLSYSAPRVTTQQDTKTQTLIASQFFTQHIFRFDDVKPTKVLKLFLDDSTDFYFIKNIHIEARAGFYNKVIGDWNGQAILKLLSDQKLLESSNTEFIVLNNQKKNGFVLIDGPISTAIRKAITESTPLHYWHLLASLVCGIFISLLFSGIFNKGERRLPTTVSPGRLSLSSLAFFGIILLFLINSIWGVIPDKKSHENRRLAPLEPLTTKTIFHYPDILSDYTNDHFAFRNILFTIHSALRAKLFQSSTLPDRVIIGKRGWFFETDSFAINDFRRLNRFTEQELSGMLHNLQERIQWLEARGIRYYIMIPPNRNRLYHEFFPDRYSVVSNYGHDRLDYYKQFLGQHDIHLIDPTDSLLRYSKLRDVYYSTDTHWNIFGAWVGYNDLLNHIRKDFPCLHPLQYNDLVITDSFNNRGDLAGMLGLEDVYRRKEMVVSLKDTQHHLAFPPVANIIMKFQNEDRIDTCGLKMMMFRDSYSNYLLPFLNLHFKEATYVWSYDFLPELIEEKKPDIVILEVQQRAMVFGLQNPNLFKKP